MIRKLRITAVGIALSISSCMYAQNIDKIKLDTYFDVLELNNKFIGSVAVSKNDNIIYTKATGYVDLVSKQKSTIDTKYRIGSVSKTFTAVLVLKAVELQKISLDEKIIKFFPNLKNAEKISISDLLYHRSGIHSFTDEEEYLTYYTEKQSRSRMLETINKYPNDFEADTQAKYSNSNYVLLSYILEDVFKDTYAAILNSYIVRPLKLKNTSLGGKIKSVSNETYSYHFQGNWIKADETDISVPIGAGGIISTPSDLVQFIEGLFNEKIISKSSLQKMITLKDNYGMGIFPMSYNNDLGYGHNGTIDGYQSVVSYFPSRKEAVAIIANGTNMNLNDVDITLLNALNNLPFTIPNFNKRIVTSSDLDIYLGIYKSEQLPLKITISKKDNVLFAQATGQSAFPMETLENNQFSFDEAGIMIAFNTKENSFVLNQGGGKFLFIKE